MLEACVRSQSQIIGNGASLNGSSLHPRQSHTLLPPCFGAHHVRHSLQQPVRRDHIHLGSLRCQHEAGTDVRVPASVRTAGGGCPFHSGSANASLPSFESAHVFKSSSIAGYQSGAQWAEDSKQSLNRSDLREIIDDLMVFPGPRPWNFENVVDLSYIARYGIEEAVLHYSRKYGPLCR